MRIVHVLLLLAGVLRQDSEPAPESRVAGAAVPAGAVRVIDKSSVDQMTVLLQAVTEGTSIKGVEVLMWPGDSLGDKGAALRKNLAGLLEKAGYEVRQETSDRKLPDREVFVAAAVGKGRRIVGVWIFAKEAAALIWGTAEEKSFGNVIYAAPKGWKETVADDAVTLTPDDLLPQEKLFVLILPGKELKGELRTAAEALWTETCASFQVDGGKPGAVDVYTSLKGWKYFRTGGEVRPANGRLFLQLTAIHVGDRVERVACLSNYVNPPYQDTTFDCPKYRDAVDAFIFGLRFKNHAEPKMDAGALQGEGIVGVWAGLSMGFTARTGDLDYKSTVAAFYSNGMVFYSAKLQTFLFDGVSPAFAREITPRWWGTWTFDKTSGSMKMLFGEIPLELKGELLVLTTNKTEHKFVRLAKVDGARFDGTYAFQEDQGKVPKITFSADGTFKDDGALKVLEHNSYPLYGICRKPGEGTYEVKNWTIRFRYGDGREFKAACLGLGAKAGDPRPKELTLGFNHDTMKRQ
jgi:hypothetical protein